MGVRIVAAFFADAASQGDDARFSAIGGGLHSVESADFPLPFDVESIVVGLRVDGPRLETAELEMRFLAPDGSELSRIAGDLQIHQPIAIINGPGEPDPIAERVLWVVLPLAELSLEHPGVYRATFRIDGVLSDYTLPLVVSPIADAPDDARPN